MPTTNYSQPHRASGNEAHDTQNIEAETLLFLELASSIAPAPTDVTDIPDAEKVTVSNAVETVPDQSQDFEAHPAFDGIGVTLTDPHIIARFNGVRRDLEREIRGGLCTIEQAQRYLEHLEITLLLEQED